MKTYWTLFLAAKKAPSSLPLFTPLYDPCLIRAVMLTPLLKTAAAGGAFVRGGNADRARTGNSKSIFSPRSLILWANNRFE